MEHKKDLIPNVGYAVLLFSDLRNLGSSIFRLEGKKSKEFKNREFWGKRDSLKRSFYHDVLKYLNRANYAGCLAVSQPSGPQQEVSHIMAHKCVWSF